jgi:endoribonuclease Dicer
LAPQLTTKKVAESDVDPIQLQKIKDILKKLPTDASKYSSINNLFQCNLFLPLNSPLRDEVIGDVMPTKRLAKRAVALKASIKLHELKELNDNHLFPMPRLNVIDDDLSTEDKENSSAPQLNKENIAVYNQRLPGCFSNCRPLPGQQCFVNAIDFTLIKPCLRNLKMKFESQFYFLNLGCVGGHLVGMWFQFDSDGSGLNFPDADDVVGINVSKQVGGLRMEN